MGNSEFQTLLDKALARKEDLHQGKTINFNPAESLPASQLWSFLYSQNLVIPTLIKQSQSHLSLKKSLYRAKSHIKPTPSPKPKPRPKHLFDERQASAFLYFKAQTNELLEGFFEEELTQAFRKLALKYHPDHGGQAQDFIDLRKHYKSLKSLFTQNLPTSAGK
jgi:hypothetical protein